MKRFFTSVIFLPFAMMAFSQNLSITFSATGAATQIDSVTATNLATNESIKLPGNQILLLTPKTGLTLIEEDAIHGLIYPNPFSGTTTFIAGVTEALPGSLKVQNIVGQVIAQLETLLLPGDNRFELSVAADGIYLVSLTTDQGTTGYKVICSGSSGSANSIRCAGTLSDQVSHGLKSGQSGFTLGYSAGDILLYRCQSGDYVTIFTDSPGASKDYTVEFTACTDRGDKNYPVVVIGGQTWMAENLAWLPVVSPSTAGSGDDRHYYVYGYQGSGMADATATANFATYGVLYNWQAARIACPNGWGLPTDGEWTTLTDYLGSSAGGKLKETGMAHWYDPNTGATNESGFGALPGGYRSNNGIFKGITDFAFFWSSTGENGNSPWYRSMVSENDQVLRDFNVARESGFSVRCLKGGAAMNTAPVARFTISPAQGTTETKFDLDASSSTDAETPVNELEIRWDIEGDDIWDTDFDLAKVLTIMLTKPGSHTIILEVKDAGGLTDAASKTIEVNYPEFTDSRDGNVYPYTKIGTQTWMVRNLAWLPVVTPSSTGNNAGSFYYVNGYQGTNVDAAKATSTYTNYGALYNFNAAKTACPAGWHVPTDEEWITLEKYLGMPDADAYKIDAGSFYRGSATRIGSQVKETGTSHWNSPNSYATNTTGLSIIPGGARMLDGTFLATGADAVYWTGTEINATNALERSMHVAFSTIGRINDPKEVGLSVRCIKD